MAKTTLETNFQDDILNSSMGNKRRYNLIQNSDGTVSLEDVSTYDQVGSEYGAGQVNSQNKAINESADAGKIIDDVDDIEAVTEGGYIAGALALKEVNSNLGGFTPIIDSSTGKITGYKTKAGADTVFPFKSGVKIELLGTGLQGSGEIDVTQYDGWDKLTVDNFKWENMGIIITGGVYSPYDSTFKYDNTTGIYTYSLCIAHYYPNGGNYRISSVLEADLYLVS